MCPRSAILIVTPSVIEMKMKLSGTFTCLKPLALDTTWQGSNETRSAKSVHLGRTDLMDRETTTSSAEGAS